MDIRILTITDGRILVELDGAPCWFTEDTLRLAIAQLQVNIYEYQFALFKLIVANDEQDKG